MALSCEDVAVSCEDVEASLSRIAPYICKTPVVKCQALDNRASLCLFLKAESLQVTGSFKIRGATNAILQLSADQLRDGVVTHSSGNHGAALAHAAQASGASATVIMPFNTPSCKVNAARGAGGTLVLCEATIEARTQAASAHMEAHPRSTLIPPYNHPHIVAGQGTVALELLQQVAHADFTLVGTPAPVTRRGSCTASAPAASGAAPGSMDEDAAAHGDGIEHDLSLHAVVVPVSGGGLISGIATAVKAKLPECKVIAAEPRGKNDMADTAACMAAGKLVHLAAAPDTIADGLRAKLGDVTWPIIQRHVDAVVTVSDEEIVAAMRALAEDTKLAVEPSGAAALAAAMSPAFRRAAPGCTRVAVVLSGGNVDYESVGAWQAWAKRAEAGAG
eukprot:jgi/Ulvmu1/10805/UM069_0041.1